VPLVDCHDVIKVYGGGAAELTVLDRITLRVPEGAFVALTGPSGSGKTTLLNLIAGIDLSTSGRVVVAGTDVSALSESERAGWRHRNVGCMFQIDTLLPALNAIENVELPLLLDRLSRGERRERALNALELVGLGDRAREAIHRLSSDERQRLSFARTIVPDPKLLVADEPTRHLDARGAGRIKMLLQKLNTDLGKTIVVVTRDVDLAESADEQYRLEAGALRCVMPEHRHSSRVAGRLRQ
jgi:putative ABC transport system ATP-binding protein